MSQVSHTLVPRLLLLLALGIGVGLFVLGHRHGYDEYYTLPLVDRPFHPSHHALRPSGGMGLLFAVAGTTLMLLNLTYLLRKRLAHWKWLGALRGWMSFHVLTGIVGPSLIVLHSGLAPTSSIGILSFTAMLIVVGAGLLGRYIYGQVPRSLEGRELELHEVRKELESHRAKLEGLGVEPALLEMGTGPERDAVEHDPGFLQSLRAVLAGNLEARREYRRLRAAVAARASLQQQAGDILPLARRITRTHNRLARYRELRALMGSWRFFHRWLAIVMLLVVVFHIVLAIEFGDLWLLGGADR